MDYPKKIAFVGDTHCGSWWGLWPKSQIPSHLRYSGINYLMNCWKKMISGLDEDIDVLFIMGDIIDGRQYRAKGVGVFSSDLMDQVDGAVEVWKPLMKRVKKSYRVTGTPYHEGVDRVLKVFDQEFGVEGTEQVFDLSVGKNILNVAHHPMGGTALYAGTKVDKEGLYARLANAKGKLPMPRWVVRAHHHNYIHQDTGDMDVISTPCWQLITPYAKKVGYWKWQPDLGIVLMEYDKSYPSNYRFRPILFDPPQVEVKNI